MMMGSRFGRTTTTWLPVVLFLGLGFLCQDCSSSISIQKREATGGGGGVVFNLEEGDFLGEGHSHSRRRRDVSLTSSSSKIHNFTNVLNATHNQLLVHWAGEQVIVCLARDVTANSSSTLFISRDYGSSFTNVTNALVGVAKDQPPPKLDKFYKPPMEDVHGLLIFTDVQNKYIFSTRSYGQEFNITKVSFVPDDIFFDPSAPNNVVALEKTTSTRQMWISQDYGINWRKVQDYVKVVAWDQSVLSPLLFIQRVQPSGLSVVLSSESLFLDDKTTQVAMTDVDEFQIHEDYKFVTRRVNNSSLELHVAYKQGPFQLASFPFSNSEQIQAKHYHVADVSSDGQIFVCVVHNESLSNLYIGNKPEDDITGPRFSLSLERILFFKPNLTLTDSWLMDVTDETFVDLHSVDGLRGVYIASQLRPTSIGSTKLNVDDVVSVITYNQGGDWEALRHPDFDYDGNPIYCKYTALKNQENCSLHVSQQLSQLYPTYRAVPIMSKKSAVGLVLATGTVNTTLKGRLGVYLSNDGAVSWKQILQGNYLYSFGDHGGIIVATKYYRIGDATNELVYSIDEGQTWEAYQFYHEKVRVLGLMTEPGENTSTFFVFASTFNAGRNEPRHSWLLIKLDFKDLFERNCTKSDYYQWSPWDSKPGRSCLLGQKEQYERRDVKNKCYNGQNYVRSVVQKVCTCERSDYECDFGFVEDQSMMGSGKCIVDNSATGPGVKPEWCKPGTQSYTRTKGYRKIPGDKCNDTSEYDPDTIFCPLRREVEFMLVAKRNSVLRIDLNNFNITETLPLPKVNSVIAIEYDMTNDCLYWSDVEKDHIMRLHLDGTSEPEHLVSTGLKSVEGLAFDWLSQNLYFSDGNEARIEVIRTNVNSTGRMRKVILKRPQVYKPRGLTVHPPKGYLFWTDWSAEKPSVGRSLLDGSEALSIVTDTQYVKWPNGITIDFMNSRLYWVDAFLDKIASCDFDGKHLQGFLTNDNRVNHPFAVGVHKKFLYWDDWTTRSIYFARTDAVDVKKSIFLVLGNQSRLMDLKVYGAGRYDGSNACANTASTCPYLCFAYPNNTASCDCPDLLKKTTNSSSPDHCVCPDGKPLNENGTCSSTCMPEENFFTCGSGYCVPAGWKCDGDKDCPDGSDEDGCDSPVCTKDQFQCTKNKKCIPSTFFCDFDHDCGVDDPSDENNCTGKHPVCTGTHFQCDNGRCILKKWVCDSEDDCGDGGSDERNCTSPTRTNHTCLINEYQCENEDKCLSADWVCDGDRDCSSGSDETNCSKVACPEWKFNCGDGHCILMSWRCDGDPDCPNGNDEASCPSTTTPPPGQGFDFGTNCSQMEQMFECTSSQCIPSFWKCDGVKDCTDGSDELDCGGRGRSTESPPTTLPTVGPLAQCDADQYRCNNSDLCISLLSKCDSYPDCPEKDDEANCAKDTATRVCKEGFEHCGLSPACFPFEKYCDGVRDCPHGEDEMACPPPLNGTRTDSSARIMITTGNALAIVLTVLFVIVILVTVLGVYIVRHKRLQNSFLNFASSHYSTHSGAATFQHNGHGGMDEDHDSPVIRGFADDEPLIV